MQTTPLVAVIKVLCILGLLFSIASPVYSFSEPPEGLTFVPAAPDGAPGVVLVARDLVDLKWNPANYPSGVGRFKRWELYVGTSPTHEAQIVITSGTDQTTGFYRHDGLDLDTTWYYRLNVVRCTEPCLTAADETHYTYFEDSVTTGVFSGELYRSLTLKKATYEIGFSEVHSSAVVYIYDGAALVVPSKTHLTKNAEISHGSIMVLAGSLSIKGATLTSVNISMGEYNGSQTSCSGTLEDVTLVDSGVSVYAACRMTIQGQGGTFSANATNTGSLTIQEAFIDGSVRVEAQAVGTLTNNHITGGVDVSGYYAPTDPKARAYLHGNLISSPYHNQGVTAYDGASVYLSENTLSYTGHVDSESSVLLQATDPETKLVAVSNRFENGKILLHWNPTVEIKDNVLVGAGSAITVGCVVCGTAAQATGTIEDNTLQSGWGFEMWDGSQSVALRHNCIRGNNPGMTVVNTLPVNLDAKYNYWGDASGPKHPTNPGGTGDEIDGNKVDFQPWDTTEVNCKETPPEALPDLTPVGMEVVQTSQTMENSVPLAAGKATVVRVYAQSSRGTVANVSCELRAYRGETLLGTVNALVPRLPVNAYKPIIQLRRNPTGGWLYILPNDWLAAGDLRLEAVINHDGNANELIQDNNTIERTVTFTERRTLRIAFVPIRYHTPLTDDTPNQTQILPMLWMIRRMYPLYDVQAEVIPSPMEWRLPLGSETLQTLSNSTLVDRLMARFHLFNKNRPADRKIDQIYGVLPNSAGITYCTSDPRWFNHPLTGSAGKGRAAYCIVGARYLAHEIGHNLGLRHPNTPDSCGAQDANTDWPKSDATIGDPGVDVIGRRVKFPEFHDIMSYCPNPQWISPFHAIKLFKSNGYPQPASRPQVDTNYLFVRGQVTSQGEVTLMPAWQLGLSSPPENPPEGSDYCIELQDAGGGHLSSYCFDPQFAIYEAFDTSDIATFEIALPMTSGAARLVVKQDGVVVAQAQASAQPPQVSVLSPNGGESLSGNVTVSWSASDPDGGELIYHLLYSPDDGLTWVPVGEFLTESEYTLDSSHLIGSQSGRFRVIASDGFHTSQDDSDGSFSTPDNPPLAGIGTPVDGGQGLLPLDLSGAGYDYEDGELPDESLAWHSDLDGHLGSGRDLLLEELSIGLHHLTLTVTDSQGQTDQHTISYRVLSPPKVFLPLISR